MIKRKVNKTGTKLESTHMTKHKIDVQDHEPIKQRYYHVSPKVREYMYEEIDKMLEEDVIEPSNSDWSNPVVMIKKPNGKYRFCLDFRKVNKITKKDLYPIPIMAEILDALRSARYISKIDLRSAYHQIPLEEESSKITAFTVPGKGMYQFKRMPFGLTNAPATFQRLMDKIITPDLKPNVFCYLDDIIIVTENFEEHLKNLEIVLEKINQAGLTINLEKCEFGCSEVKYLGFIVNEKGLLMDEDKIKPILEFPTPKNVKQLQRIIGMTSWYRRFIPKFSEIMEPLHTLLKKGVEWKWNAHGTRSRVKSKHR